MVHGFVHRLVRIVMYTDWCTHRLVHGGVHRLLVVVYTVVYTDW